MTWRTELISKLLGNSVSEKIAEVKVVIPGESLPRGIEEEVISIYFDGMKKTYLLGS